MKLRWHNKDIARLQINDKSLHPFIFQTGSLTRYIQQQCKGTFHIDIKSEAWRYPMPDEVRLLKMRTREHAFIRESWLKCDNQPMVYARTVIPRKTLKGKCKELTRLGTKPLGEILFADKTTYRSVMRYAMIPAQCELYNQASKPVERNTGFWGRQSLFYIKNKPLLIIEVFLPSIKECIQS